MMLLNYTRWRFNQIKARVVEEKRTFSQGDCSIALVGAFHETNLGDISLRIPFEKALSKLGKRFAIQNLYRISKYKSTDKIIITGGATGVKENIEAIYSRYKNCPDKVVMCGMDFSDLSELKDDRITFLSDCKGITLRSKDQYSKFVDQGFSNVDFAYDNAFALDFELSSEKQKKAIGINILNLFMTWTGKKFEPGTFLLPLYKRNDPDAEQNVLKIGPAYVNYFNHLVNALVAQGFTVEHIPFTPEDDFFARTFLNSKVRFLNYSRDPFMIINKISTYERFYSTRFHATVFGLISKTPTVPFIYSKKCADLIEDLDLDHSDFVQRDELLNTNAIRAEDAINHSGIKFSDQQFLKYRSSAFKAIENSVRLLLPNH
ncbi:MAG: polysaccharide pyruvyl transferase family protein [Cyclobacteriaceae bacterium]